jgi:O-antigen ligase
MNMNTQPASLAAVPVTRSRVYNVIRVFLILVALYPLIDFLFRNTMGHSSVGLFKTVAGAWKELLLVCLFVLWYVNKRTHPQAQVQKTRLHWMILIATGGAVLSIVANYATGGSPSFDLATNQWITVHETAGIAIAGLRTLLESALFFLFCFALIGDEETLLEMANLMIFAATLLAIYGIYQRLSGMKTPSSWVYADAEGGATRVFSTIDNPNDLGALMLLISPIAISFVIFSRNLLDKVMYGVVTVLMLTCMLFTLSRGAWIGLICAVLMYVVLTKNWKLLAALVVVGLAVAFFVPSLSHRLTLVFDDSYLSKAKHGGRLQFWPRALHIWQHNPIFGAGLGLVGDSVAIVKKVPGATWIDNQYIKVIGETGLVGILSYLAMLFTPIVSGFKWLRSQQERHTLGYALNTGIVSALFGFLVENFVEGVFETWVISTYFWVLVAMLLANMRLSRKQQG